MALAQQLALDLPGDDAGEDVTRPFGVGRGAGELRRSSAGPAARSAGRRPDERPHAATASASRPAVGSIGRRTWKVVPSPGMVSNVSAPPWRSTIIVLARGRPWPVPRPTSLVVKNGSNTRAATSGGMPPPVSATLTTT